MVSSRIDSYSKKEAAASTCSGEEGAGVQEAEGQTIQPLQTNGPSRQGVEGQSSWPASMTGWTTLGDRSDRFKQPVWLPRATGQTGWGCIKAESRIGNARFGSLRWRNTASILGTRQWGASGSWGYIKSTAIWSSTTFKCSGGKILATDDLPHEVSVQRISLQGALKTLIMFLKCWVGWNCNINK